MSLPLALLLIALVSAPGAAREIIVPFETAEIPPPVNGIDTEILVGLQQRGLEPTFRCTDEVYVRRAYLDLTGTLPTPGEARDFIMDAGPEKRADLVDALMERPAFADYWAMKWSDVLRVKGEFPIKLWPNAVQAYHRWIRDAMATNMPYSDFARALLTSSGSNFRVAPVNFYRASQNREQSGIAEVVALTFMGARVSAWPEQQRTDLEAFFTRVAFKGTEEWKEDIVYLNPEPVGPFEATFPDGSSVTIRPDQDPRDVFAEWLIQPDNEWFARAMVNRMWAWLFGRGVIHESDDIRPDNPPAYPGVLSYLESELAQSDFDLRHLIRTIMASNTYQQSSIAQIDSREAEEVFACYPVQRLDAEVLADALCYLGGESVQYTNEAPEPFTYIPPSQRSIQLADGSITSSFLEMFGRPPRDTGLMSERSANTTASQRLYLLNSSDIQRRVQNSPLLRAILNQHQGDRPALVREVYLLVLSRYPTFQELALAVGHGDESGLGPQQLVADTAWALVNGKEFLFRH